MFGKTSASRPPEDPAVAPVEQILQAAAARHPVSGDTFEDRPSATHALWICACVTPDDAPIWLMYAVDEDGVAWCRVPPQVRVADVVDAALRGGGHADPAEVLRWLQGDVSDPWAHGGWGDGDAGVVEEIRRRIQHP